MDSKLKLVSTKNMSHEDWLNFRFNGLGGSDISAVVGLNPYMSNVKLFYQKLGEVPNEVENVHMFAGKRSENMIAEDYWRFHDPEDPTPNNYVKNFNADKIIRKCRRVNAYILNPDYPYAIASVDRIINKGSNDKEGILECKAISGYAADVWIAGIPPMYLCQLQWYLMVTGLEYGEMAMLKDGKWFDSIPFERNEEFIKYLDKAAKEFWDRVTRARILKQNGKPYEQLEPEANNQEAFKAFLSERYNATENKIAPSAHYYNLAVEIKGIDEKIKELENEKLAKQNEIKNYMKDSNVMDFGPNSGKITWKEQAGKKSIDMDLLQKEAPELYQKVLKVGEPFRVLRLGIKVEKETEQAQAA